MSTQRISEFDLWQPGYGGAIVSVYIAGTTTLANIYSDESLTNLADNPQTLSSLSGDGGVNYGKFAVPLYTSSSYFLDIGGTEETGIERPTITSLDGEDISQSLITMTGSSYPVTMAEFAANVVYVKNFGSFLTGNSAVENTETLNLAIAALTDGGEAVCPAGTYDINAIDIPANVIISGQGKNATRLVSVLGDVSFTLNGNRSGFRKITLDGSTLVTGSVAVKSVGNDETIFDEVTIKRFKTGIHFLGGKGHIWYDFSIENTENAAKLHGDLDAGDTNLGGAFEDLIWTGGLISVATTKGLSFSYEDAVCHNINLISVGFESCTGIAVDINGAQNLEYSSCWFKSNTKNVNIVDDDDVLTPSTSQKNDSINVRFTGGRFNGGQFEINDTAQNVILDSVKIEDVDFILTTPLSSFLILKDCYEDPLVTIAGETTKLIRVTTTDDGTSVGLTTTNTATKAWAIALEAGQMVFLEAKVIGRGRNVAQRGIYHITSGAYRVGSALAYDTQTANFTAGTILTGATSGATARIQADSDSGTTGTLTLIDIKGAFVDNEIITDNNGTPGSATVNGTLTPTGATLDGTGITALRTAYETNANWAVAFVANGNEIELRVTGDTSQTVEWTVDVDVVSI